MKDRWLRGPEIVSLDDRHHFDPVSEGSRYGLLAEVAQAIWEGVRRDATYGSGRCDEHRARQRFHEVAALVAERGFLQRAPGRETRSELEASGFAWSSDVFHVPSPGKTTRVLVETQRWEQRTGGASASDEPRPNLREVHEVLAGMTRTSSLDPVTRPPSVGASTTRPDHASVQNARTQEAIAALAPRLGLDPAAVEVRSDEDAERRLAAAGASGFMDSGIVYLAPRRYDPSTSRGQYLLAHELVHVAQARIEPRGDGPTGLAAAEAEAAQIGHAWADGHSIAAPTVSLPVAAAADTGAEQLAKVRPAAQSDFVLRAGNDDFVVSFELLPKGTGGEVRVVVSPTDFSRAYQSEMKYWDVRGREVDKDDTWTSMGNWSVPAAAWTQQAAIADPTKFDPVILKTLPEKTGTVWTFDWNGDAKPEYAIRIDFSISNTIRDYNFTASDNKSVKKFGFHFVQDDAWKYGYQGNSAPRRHKDDFFDVLGDILTSKTTWEMAITMIPVIGEIVLLGEAISGYTIFGDKMSTAERVVSGLAAVLPVAGGVIAKGVTKAGADLAKIAVKVGRTEEEVMALLRAAEKQGAEAATVEKWSSTLKSGGKLAADEVAKLQRVVRQLEADQRVFRAAEQEMGASRILRKGGKIEQTGPVSLKRLRNTLGRSGVSPSGYHLRKATKADLDALRAGGTDPSTVYAWVSRDGAGVMTVDAKGRPVMTFTEKGLSSLEEAVKSFGHEAKHIKDFAAGMTTSSEALAEKAGEELWELVKRKLGK